VVDVGLTVLGFTIVASDHTYVVAPAAVNVADCPEQIARELTVTVGIALTVIVPVAEEEQPKVVPVTV
jgi:hypothetical protein